MKKSQREYQAIGTLFSFSEKIFRETKNLNLGEKTICSHSGRR